MYSLLFLAIRAGASFVPLLARTGPDPDRYSSCFGDRGGLFMTKSSCVYGHVNTTVVSLCNGNGRNRTVGQDEVRRGIQQLQKDCGGDGAFSGVHVVNNLTFAAYGVYGGRDLVVPADSPPPNLPGGTRRRDPPPSDPCINHGYTADPYFNCKQPEGHTLNSDRSCGQPNIENKCEVYCEVKRTYFIGMETTAPGTWGDQIALGVRASLQEEDETTISKGFSIGIDGNFGDAITSGVGFEYSVEHTTVKTIPYEVDIDNVNYYRWVFFPKLVETCASVSKRAYSSGSPCPPPVCGGGGHGPTCDGDIETVPLN
ncbi:hypothetical protein NKR23_g4108 [Pleurostoma richardsiae]|uniref:Uncharacterized protein n=1 Tax=Pleurostoma richardsiae TaxID=41990 RepID=A0AA38VG97_9PEZI|nr:hypothetical protein NKR23_g4108 [Pleurostoma richardsiae]